MDAICSRLLRVSEILLTAAAVVMAVNAAIAVFLIALYLREQRRR